MLWREGVLRRLAYKERLVRDREDVLRHGKQNGKRRGFAWAMGGAPGSAQLFNSV